LTKTWVPHDVRDQVVDFVRRWSEKTEISVGRFPQWLGIGVSKFYDWRQRYGRVNEHNGWIPRDFWLEPWEKEAIIGFSWEESLGGLSAADVHDAGCGGGGGEPSERMARAAASGTAVAMES
jgi:2-polyprenyl-3-methyl-5-hydroxy-6-metoxy-1,4-benzoquinol methylase